MMEIQPVSRTDMVAYMSGDGVVSLYASGVKQLNNSQRLGVYLHGSNQKLTKFRPGIFFTTEVVGAINFALLANLWAKSNVDAGAVYIYKLQFATNVSVIKVSKKTHPSLYDRTGGPADLSCAEFSKMHDCVIQFDPTTTNDAGTHSVWYAYNPSLIKIVRRYRVWFVDNPSYIDPLPKFLIRTKGRRGEIKLKLCDK